MRKEIEVARMMLLCEDHLLAQEAAGVSVLPPGTKTEFPSSEEQSGCLILHFPHGDLVVSMNFTETK